MSTLHNIYAHCRPIYGLYGGQTSHFVIWHFLKRLWGKCRPMNTNITKEGCALLNNWNWHVGREIKKSVCQCDCELMSVTNRIILIVCLCAYTLKQIYFIWMLWIVLLFYAAYFEMVKFLLKNKLPDDMRSVAAVSTFWPENMSVFY